MSMEKIPGPMDEAVLATVRTVARDARMQKALAIAHDRAEEAMALQVHISEIPAPTFEERTRAEEIVRLMKEAGLEDVSIDEIGNVVGRRPGRNPEGPLLAIGAHMDTVFPAGTDVTVRREGNTYYGPGIGDNASGVRTVLEAVRALNEAGVETQGDIWFCTTVGEEGLGDIRGSKHLFREKNAVNKIDGFLAVDNSNIGRILFGAIGSHRWRFTEGAGRPQLRRLRRNAERHSRALPCGRQSRTPEGARNAPHDLHDRHDPGRHERQHDCGRRLLRRRHPKPWRPGTP